jgi:hypothetical protein
VSTDQESIQDTLPHINRPRLEKTDWYSKRLALTNSFMLAELHMISPEQQDEPDISSSIQLYRRLVPSSRVQAAQESSFPNSGQWGKWGAQGWLGE